MFGRMGVILTSEPEKPEGRNFVVVRPGFGVFGLTSGIFVAAGGAVGVAVAAGTVFPKARMSARALRAAVVVVARV